MMQAVITITPVYTIKQLMFNKYGEDRFALACEIVARWVQFETKNKEYDAHFICRLANAHADSEFDMPYEVEEPLRQLFGLKTTDLLYNE